MKYLRCALTAFLVVAAFFFVCAHADAPTPRASIVASAVVTPAKMVSPGSAGAAIKLKNNSAAPIPVSVYIGSTLILSCDVPPGISGYSGRVDISVADAHLKIGEVMFVAEYGDETVSFSAPVIREESRPELELTRKLSASYATLGQEVSVSYAVRNRGNVKLTGIKLSDPAFGTIAENVELEVGERKSFSCAMEMEETFTTRPQAIFSAEGARTRHGVSVAPTKVTLVSPELSVTLSVNRDAVAPGDAVALTCEVTNVGDVPLNRLIISDDTLGELNAYSGTLPPGASYSYTREVRVSRDAEFVFAVTGRDLSQITTTAQSEPVVVKVTSLVDAPDLSIVARTDTRTMQRPGRVNFTIIITNLGEVAVNDVIISEAGSGMAQKIDELLVGETVIERVFDVPNTQDFAFSARYEGVGGERVFLSPLVSVTVGVSTLAPAQVTLPPRDEQPTADPFARAPSPDAVSTSAQDKASATDRSRTVSIVAAIVGCLGLIAVAAYSLYSSRKVSKSKKKK